MIETAVLESTYEKERNKPMPSKNHGKIQTRVLVNLVNNFSIKYEFISELSLELNEWLCTPDIAIYNKEPLDVYNDEVRMSTPPLGIIEILSPTQTLNDLTDKAVTYFEHGVKSCWLVLPTLKTIYVFSGREQFEAFVQDEVVKDHVLDIQLPLSNIFS